MTELLRGRRTLLALFVSAAIVVVAGRFWFANGDHLVGPLGSLESPAAQSEKVIRQCLPVADLDVDHVMVLSSGLTFRESDLEDYRGMVVTGLRYEEGVGVADVREVLVVGAGSPFVFTWHLDQSGRPPDGYEFVDLPAAVPSSGNATASLVLEVRNTGLDDSVGPVARITGIEYQDENGDDYVLPVDFRQSVNWVTMNEDEDRPDCTDEWGSR